MAFGAGKENAFPHVLFHLETFYWMSLADVYQQELDLVLVHVGKPFNGVGLGPDCRTCVRCKNQDYRLLPCKPRQLPALLRVESTKIEIRSCLTDLELAISPAMFLILLVRLPIIICLGLTP